MPTPTYTPLANFTLASAVASITFGSIPSTYRDLVIVVTSASASTVRVTINGDTGSNYSLVNLRASASGASSATTTSANVGATDDVGFGTLQIFDYSATNKHKTMIRRRVTTAGDATDVGAVRWASTAAITTLRFDLASGNLPIGTNCSLYGIVS
jgi:hypothetical protein